MIRVLVDASCVVARRSRSTSSLARYRGLPGEIPCGEGCAPVIRSPPGAGRGAPQKNPAVTCRSGDVAQNTTRTSFGGRGHEGTRGERVSRGPAHRTVARPPSRPSSRARRRRTGSDASLTPIGSARARTVFRCVTVSRTEPCDGPPRRPTRKGDDERAPRPARHLGSAPRIRSLGRFRGHAEAANHTGSRRARQERVREQRGVWEPIRPFVGVMRSGVYQRTADPKPSSRPRCSTSMSGPGSWTRSAEEAGG